MSLFPQDHASNWLIQLNYNWAEPGQILQSTSKTLVYFFKDNMM